MVRINRRLRYKGHIKGGHILCGLVTLLCLWFTVSRFSNAIPRLILAFRDVGVSVAYFFTVPYGIEGITPTVTELPTFGNGGTVPAVPLPVEWSSAKIKFVAFWKMFINGDLFKGFWEKLRRYSLPLLVPCLTLLAAVLVLICVYKKSVGGHNNDYGQDSKAVKNWKGFSRHTLFPLKERILDIRNFLEDNVFWLKIWAFIWLINFNLISLVVDFFGLVFLFCR